MNRYVIQGIIMDVFEGKQVALVAGRRADAKKAFDAVRAKAAEVDLEWDEVRLTNGCEELNRNGGSVRIVTANSRGPRGLVLDVAVLLDGLRTIEGQQRREDFLADLIPTGNTRPNGLEIIYCE